MEEHSFHHQVLLSPLIFFDDFTTATDDNILSTYAGYTTNSTSPANPMYINLGGSISVIKGIVEITGATITIGACDRNLTTSASKPEGCFDLSSPYTIYIGISYLASGSGSDSKFYFMVDNNTKSATSSPLGVSSFFFEKRFAEVTNRGACYRKYNSCNKKLIYLFKNRYGCSY